MQSVYDNPIFFERYLQLRENPKSVNEVIEKPTMLSLLPDLQGKNVLDLGCGVGDHLKLYLELGAEKVVGLDLSAEMLMQANKNLSQLDWAKGRYSFYDIPMQALNVVQGEFDVITSSFAFHYIENFPDLLAKIYQKLKPNGTLVFSQEHPITTCYQGGDRWEKDEQKRQVAYRLNFYRDEGVRERNWFQQPFKTYHRTMATIINQLIDANFTIEKVAEPMLSDQPEWHDEFKDLQHRPNLLFIKALKKV